MTQRPLLACLVVSGGCALAWELLWTRLLALTFGSTTLSFSTVLAAFFGGLALGSWAAGRRAAALRRPVRVYAWIELATGALGLLLYPVMRHLGALFAAIDPGSGLPGALARFAVAAPLLLVPTFLMGATLPVVAAATIRKDEAVGEGSALIYGFNTLGAFLGTYLVTYHLIPGLGVFGTVLAAALANAAAGALALWIDRRGGAAAAAPAAAAAAAPPEPATPERRSALALAGALTFCSGFAFIGLEIVWSRLFSAFLMGTIYGLGAVLICFLVGIGLGSLAVARWLRDERRIGLLFAAAQLAALAAALLLFAGLGRVAHLLQLIGASRGPGIASQHLQLAVVLGTLLIPTLASGASFPMLVRLVESRARGSSRALGSLLAANTLGSILGSLLTGFLLIPALGSVGAAALALALIALSAALAGTLLTRGRQRPAGALLGAAALALVANFGGFDVRLVALEPAGTPELYQQFRERHATRLRQLLYFAEGRDGTLSVSEIHDSRGLRINGLGQGSLRRLPPHYSLESVLVGLVPLRHVAAPDRALVVGLGAGITVDLLARLGVPEITVVEIEPRVADAVEVIYLGESPLRAPGVRVVVDDARHHLMVAAHRGAPPLDLIASMPSHPWVAPNAFTREFFALARANLAPDGVFSTWFTSNRMDGPTVKSVLRAFCEVFPSYVFYYVQDVGAYFLVGSPGPLRLDSARLAALHGHPVLAGFERLSDPAFLTSRIYAVGGPKTPAPPPGPVNTDDSAYVEVRAPRPTAEPPVFEGFLAREYPDPALFPEEDRREAIEAVLEHLLGTPGGRLPLETVAPLPARARRTAEAARGALTPRERAFYAGRAAALLGAPLERALSRLGDIAAGEDRLGGRAALHAALALPEGTEQRRSRLAALPPSRDAALAALEARVPDWPELLPAEADGGAGADPALWLMRRAVRGAPLSGDERDRFVTEAGPELLASDRIELLRLAERVARRSGLDSAAEALERQRVSRSEAQGRQLAQRGVEAGAAGRFADAARLLWEAHRLAPGNEVTMRLLLRALVETGDAERLRALAADFRLLGRSEEYLRALIAEARSGEVQFEPDDFTAGWEGA